MSQRPTGLGRHLIDHLAGIEAVLAGRESRPDERPAGTVTLAADWATFTDADVNEPRQCDWLTCTNLD